MFKIRRAEDRGRTKIDWLDSYHSFSFGGYYDAKHNGFGSLRVINDDIIEPDAGFAEHGHKNMEIVTYVISGALAHKDSMGNSSTIKPGEVQRMSAGTGIRHSEYNASDGEKTRLLQIWFLPAEDEIAPAYEQKFFDKSARKNRIKLLASRNGFEDSITINQDVNIHGVILDKGREISQILDSSKKYWLQMAEGNIIVNDEELKVGDAVAIEGESDLKLESLRDGSDVLIFEMA